MEARDKRGHDGGECDSITSERALNSIAWAKSPPMPSPVFPPWQAILLHCLFSTLGVARDYFAPAGNAGNLPTSRGSCWMMTVALRFAAIFLKRSTEASVAARSVLNVVRPLPS